MSAFLAGVWGYVIALVLGLAVGAFAVHKLDGTALATEKLAHANDLREVATLAAQAAGHALAVEQTLQTQLAASDATHTQELAHAHAQTVQLSSDVQRGAVRLRVLAATPHPSCSSVPGRPAAASVDNGAVELAPAARQSYYDLRAALQSDAIKIAALQDYATVCSAAR